MIKSTFENNTEVINSFEIEAGYNIKPEDIYNYIKSKSVNIKEFTLKEKLDDKIIYYATYITTTESITTLEKIKLDVIKNNTFRITKLIFERKYETLIR